MNWYSELITTAFAATMAALALPTNPDAVSPHNRNTRHVVSTMVGDEYRTDLSDIVGRRLHKPVTARFLNDSNGLRLDGRRIVGKPLRSQVVNVLVEDNRSIDTVRIVVFARDLPEPKLPSRPHAYRGASRMLPGQLRQYLSLVNADEQEAVRATPLTDAGVRLGRVLFYDTRLSSNDAVSCGSCHKQQFGFSDTARLSRGVAAVPARRHSMALANARFSIPGFSWDAKSRTIEEQSLRALFDPVEQGLTPGDLVAKVSATRYYPEMFKAAFGSREVTTQRVSQAIAQFVRALVSDSALYDFALENGSPTTAARRMTETQFRGWKRFNEAGCAQCHVGPTQSSYKAVDNGMSRFDGNRGDTMLTRAPSLRNVAIRSPYMRDGRYRSLGEVLDFYSRTQPLLPVFGELAKPERRLVLQPADKGDIIAFLRTLTDSAFLRDERYSDPFNPLPPKSRGAESESKNHSTPRREPRDRARIANGRLLIEPIGVSFVVPPLWLDPTVNPLHVSGACDPKSPSARKMVTDGNQLRTMTGTTSYFGDWQFSVVADSLFPPDELVAHIGSRAWRECDSSVGDIHVRAYVSNRLPEEIVARVNGIVVDSFPGFSRISTQQLHDSAGWSRATMTWEFNCGDCIHGERMSVYSRRVGTRTLSLVFMRGDPELRDAVMNGILSSFRTTTRAVSSSPPDSITFTDGHCQYRCESWRITVTRSGLVRRTRYASREHIDARDSITVTTQLYDSLVAVIGKRRLREAPAIMERNTNRSCRVMNIVQGKPTFLIYGETGVEKQLSLATRCDIDGQAIAAGARQIRTWYEGFATLERLMNTHAGAQEWQSHR